MTERKTHTEFLGQCISTAHETRFHLGLPHAVPSESHLLPLSSLGTRSPVLWRSLSNFRLVTCQAHCEEICRIGDTYNSFWWPCQARCKEFRKSVDTFTSVRWPARHIMRKSAGVATRKISFRGLPRHFVRNSARVAIRITGWGALQEGWWRRRLAVAAPKRVAN